MMQIIVIHPQNPMGRAASVDAATGPDHPWRFQTAAFRQDSIIVDGHFPRPPDAVVVDFASGQDPRTIKRIREAMEGRWGPSPRIPVLALVHARHLRQPDWFRDVDDFQCAPYDPSELCTRLRSLLRGRCKDNNMGMVVLPGTRLHTDNGIAEGDDGSLVSLTPRECELLVFLASNRGRYFDRRVLLDRVWGCDFDGGERTVDVHVRRLRTKLPSPTASLLDTRRGFGYGLRAS